MSGLPPGIRCLCTPRPRALEEEAATSAMVAGVIAPGTHAEGSSRELVMWAAMPPRARIRFPQFFSAEMPPRGPLELWLQHAECDAPATGAEVEVVS